jgi:hypothetical protein
MLPSVTERHRRDIVRDIDQSLVPARIVEAVGDPQWRELNDVLDGGPKTAQSFRSES